MLLRDEGKKTNVTGASRSQEPKGPGGSPGYVSTVQSVTGEVNDFTYASKHCFQRNKANVFKEMGVVVGG